MGRPLVQIVRREEAWEVDNHQVRDPRPTLDSHFFLPPHPQQHTRLTQVVSWWWHSHRKLKGVKINLKYIFRDIKLPTEKPNTWKPFLKLLCEGTEACLKSVNTLVGAKGPNGTERPWSIMRKLHKMHSMRVSVDKIASLCSPSGAYEKSNFLHILM